MDDTFTAPIKTDVRHTMRSIPLLSTALAALLLASCGGDQPQQDTLTVPAADSTAALRAARTKNIFHNIPAPMETAALLKKAGAEYEKDILNDVKHVNDYTSASKQALYNNTQESMLYTSCAQQLSKKLGVDNAFNEQVVSRLEQNRNNRDSLLSIISETYWQVDGYLKENQRDNISALMIAGGWVEGLYIASQVAAQHDTPELRQRIAEQKLPLTDLLELVKTYSPDDPAVNAVQTDLEKLTELFKDVVTPTGGATVTKENGVTVIGGGAPQAGLTDAQMKAIHDAVSAIRNAYIN